MRLSDLNFGSFPHGNTTNFYIWESLGCGVSGRAFLVSSTKSLKVGVIKCFFSSPEALTPQAKKKSRETNRNEELKHWKTVYKQYNCQAVTIFERPAILIQYFSFIPLSERRKCLEGVKKTLSQDYDRNKWMHGDVRWRNTGQDNKGKVVVFDMGSVREKTEDDKEWVNQAIEELKKQCGTGASKVLNFSQSPLSSSSSSSSSPSSSSIISMEE